MEVGRHSQKQGLHYSVHSQTRPHLLPVLILPFHFRKLSRQEMLNRRFNILIRVQISNSTVSPSLDDYGDNFVICPILELSFTAMKYIERKINKSVLFHTEITSAHSQLYGGPSMKHLWRMLTCITCYYCNQPNYKLVTKDNSQSFTNYVTEFL